MPDTIELIHPEHGRAIVGADQWSSTDDHGWSESAARAAGWKPVDEAEPKPANPAKRQRQA